MCRDGVRERPGETRCDEARSRKDEAEVVGAMAGKRGGNADKKREKPREGLLEKKRDGETARILFAIKARDNLKAITITHGLRVCTHAPRLRSSRSRSAISPGLTVAAVAVVARFGSARLGSARLGFARIVLRDRACLAFPPPSPGRPIAPDFRGVTRAFVRNERERLPPSRG